MGSSKRKAPDVATTAIPEPQPQLQLKLKQAEAPGQEDEVFDLTKLKRAKPAIDTASASIEVARPTRVFVGNVPFSATEESLRATFGTCGSVLGVHFILDKATQKWYGSCMLDFADHAGAAQAVQLSGSMLDGRPLKVNWAQGRQSVAADRFAAKQKAGTSVAAAPVSSKAQFGATVTVFVGKISDAVDESQVRELFRACGEIVEIRWVNDAEGRFRGCGFIEFNNTEATDTAVKLNGAALCGRAIRVDYAKTSDSKMNQE